MDFFLPVPKHPDLQFLTSCRPPQPAMATTNTVTKILVTEWEEGVAVALGEVGVLARSSRPTRLWWVGSKDGSSSAHFRQRDFIISMVFQFLCFFFFFLAFGFWGSFYCLDSAIFCFVFGFKLNAFKILIYSAYEFDLMVVGLFWCAVFLGLFLFPYVLAFYTNQTVLMVVVTYCGGWYLVREIGLLGYRKMSNLFKCLTPQIMSRCWCNFF